MKDIDKNTIQRIEEFGEMISEQIMHKESPNFKLPTRTKSNVQFNESPTTGIGFRCVRNAPKEGKKKDKKKGKSLPENSKAEQK